jgi:hypothetical protein
MLLLIAMIATVTLSKSVLYAWLGLALAVGVLVGFVLGRDDKDDPTGMA